MPTRLGHSDESVLIKQPLGSVESHPPAFWGTSYPKSLGVSVEISLAVKYEIRGWTDSLISLFYE